MTSWSTDIHVCAEVRASGSAIRSLSRRLAALAFASVWSAPPPRGPTFEVPPGGAAICARHPLSLRHVSVPELHSWEMAGRLVVARVLSLSHELMIVAVYGYPPSHACRGKNEDFFSQVFSWARSLRTPVIIAGDYNHTLATSRTLALAPSVGIWKVSPNDPTTRAKGGAAKAIGTAIDHIYGNYRLLDLSPSSWIDKTRWLSDHYPVMLKIHMHSSLQQVWQWPKPMKLGTKVDILSPWIPSSTTYSEWLVKAEHWISRNYQCQRVPKGCVSATLEYEKHDRIDQKYFLILSSQRALSRLKDSRGLATSLRSSLSRKFRLFLGLTLGDEYAGNRKRLDEVLKAHLDKAQDESLKRWRQSVALWHSSASELYRYLRNEKPKKCVALVTSQGHWSADPNTIHEELAKYWTGIESWPSSEAKLHALHVLEDHYALFLPQIGCKVEVWPKDLIFHSKRMRKSAPGPDAWTKEELITLPEEAWADFLSVWHCATSLCTTSLMWHKRVPIEKKRRINRELEGKKAHKP